MTKKEFQECFIILENEFGKRPIGLKKIWYRLFKDCGKEDFKKAIIYYLERIKKFPLVPNISEYTEHFKKDRTEKSHREALCIINKIDTKYQNDI